MKGDSCEHGAMTMGVARVAKTDAISSSALGRMPTVRFGRALSPRMLDRVRANTYNQFTE